MMNKTIKYILLVLGLLLFIISTFFDSRYIVFSLLILSFIALTFFFWNLNKTYYEDKKCEERYSNKFIILFSFLTSFIVLLFCSECSFLYPINIWDDSNCFFTVGKSVLSGKVLYRDLFEQKGPYLYFLHTFAALVSYKSFFGVFVLEVIFSTFVLFIIYKILILFTSKEVIYLLPLLLSIMFSSRNFQLGDSAEEFCIIFILIPLYYSVKNFETNSYFSSKELIVTGICAGCVFLIKFNMVGFFIGFCICPIILYIRQKKIKDIFLAFFYVLIGFVISLIPFAIYCLITKSFNDFYQVYIYNNIFIYTNSNVKKSNICIKIINVLLNSLKGMASYFKLNYIVMVLALLSLIKGFKTFSKMQMINYLSMYFFTALLVYGGGVKYPYYSLILDVFVIFSLIPIFNFLTSIKFLNKKILFSLCMLLSLLIVIFLPFHKSMRFMDKEKIPQFSFAKEITKIDNPKILQYGALDCGYYLTSNCVPVTKYFCRLNIPIKQMIDEQEKIIKEGEVDFIVSRGPVDFADKYELIMESDGVRPEIIERFYLYKNKNLINDY